MALEKYKQKRRAARTPEPFGGKSNESESLHFTIQKHAASRLHYDFRLEMDGVLKSWAIPKGPSTDPEIKRLAVMVEDHPYDYRNFEGIIPKGEYGGGTVIVWDEGTYEASSLKGKSKKEQEKHLLQRLSGGDLKITLNGKKLKGDYALFRLKDSENNWLLMKHKDEFADKKDITLKDKSVQSGKTIEKVKTTSKNIYGRNEEVSQKSDKKLKNKVVPKSSDTDISGFLKKAIKSKMPESIDPMLATLVDEPFDNPEWVFEVKWDGYRTIAFLNNGKTQLQSRNNKSFTSKYYPITNTLEKLKINAVLDGEIIVINKKGASDFNALQNWSGESDGNLVYYVFDLLWYDGKNLMDLPLVERQAILKEIFLPDGDNIRLSEVFTTNGKDLFKAAEKLELEGIIAKKANSTYLQGKRSKSWLKIKVHKRQEVVIGGYTLNEDTGKLLSSLLLGVYEKGSLQYVGKVGTGFTDQLKKELLKKFKHLTIGSSPFDVEPDVNQPARFRRPGKSKVVWLKPEMICEVSFAEVTEDGVFRQPSFKGLRTDKKAKEVVKESESQVAEILEETKSGSKKSQKSKIESQPSDKKTLLDPTVETQVKKIKGHELKFTNLSKVYWPEDNITKRDLLNYYYQVSEYIIPYLKDRPQSLNRFPNGIHGESFYQKDVKGKSPEWVKTFPYKSDGESKEFLVGGDEATLLWMASLGCIEMNPWFSRVQTEDYPDFCIIDLDPDKNTYDQVVEAAIEVKKVLDILDVPSYPKTSGSTGMHIYIPLGAKYTYDQSQMFANFIVNIVHQQIPEFTSLERIVRKRNGKMYLDFLQNRPGATIASPYSVRPRKGATVSMPLHWDEVKKGLKVEDFNLRNSKSRLEKTGDLFKGVLGKGINMEKVLKKAGSAF
jgi:bifunctional non-homologous end joining protein LigD